MLKNIQTTLSESDHEKLWYHELSDHDTEVGNYVYEEFQKFEKYKKDVDGNS